MIVKEIDYDVIIVGTGAAGLYAALALPKHMKILMITKDEVKNSDSYLAQGGISTLLNQEDYESYYEDTLKAGRYENNPDSVKEMIESSGTIVKELIEYGVDFDKAKDKTLDYTREGGHSTFRILHHQDITGQEIVTKLLMQAEKRENITILEYTMMIDLLEKDGTCYGVVTRQKDGTLKARQAKSVILATGGLGGLFQNSTNFPHITGDSFAIALRHNVELENIHYIQIHPTVLYSKREGRRFLISESVRGEGAKLLNEKKERFVDELLPRDVVTEAICKEMKKYHTDHVYLSFAQIEKEEILNHFPNIYQRCMEEGYDVTKEVVPVTPAQHYLMGGIKANTAGETSMPNLYAIGETACNGVHGANRLASNSLLESLVFAKHAALVISQKKAENTEEVEVDFSKYEDEKEWKEDSRRLVLEEVERKDKNFYDKWCNV